MQLANLKTFESGAFEMPKRGGMSNFGDVVKSKTCWILVLPAKAEDILNDS